MNLTRKSFLASLLSLPVWGLFIAPFVKLKKEPEPNGKVDVGPWLHACPICMELVPDLTNVDQPPWVTADLNGRYYQGYYHSGRLCGWREQPNPMPMTTGYYTITTDNASAIPRTA